MAARRRRSNRKKTRRSKYKSAFNIRAAGIAYASLALTSQAVLKVNPIQFFTAGYVGGFEGMAPAQAPGAITLKEILAGGHLTSASTLGTGSQIMYGGTTSASGQGTIGETMKTNIMENGVPLILAQIGLVAGDKIAQNLGVYRSFNKTVRAIGMGNLVKA